MNLDQWRIIVVVVVVGMQSRKKVDAVYATACA